MSECTAVSPTVRVPPNGAPVHPQYNTYVISKRVRMKLRGHDTVSTGGCLRLVRSSRSTRSTSMPSPVSSSTVTAPTALVVSPTLLVTPTHTTFSNVSDYDDDSFIDNVFRTATFTDGVVHASIPNAAPMVPLVEMPLIEVAASIPPTSTASTPSAVSVVSTATTNAVDDDDDDDVVFVGSSKPIVSAGVTLPHARYECMVHPFNRSLPDPSCCAWNGHHCPQCYCYICDQPADECKEWLLHCNASLHSSADPWNVMRVVHRIGSGNRVLHLQEAIVCLHNWINGRVVSQETRYECDIPHLMGARITSSASQELAMRYAFIKTSTGPPFSNFSSALQCMTTFPLTPVTFGDFARLSPADLSTLIHMRGAWDMPSESARCRLTNGFMLLHQSDDKLLAHKRILMEVFTKIAAECKALDRCTPLQAI